jgi:dTDP-4-dehydrorhamnose reductase
MVSSEREQQGLCWVTGAQGLIGNYLVQTARRFSPWHARGLARADLDLLDFTAVREKFRRDQPQCIIHCAAMSKSPECQQQPVLARRVNVEATASLAELARDIPFVFFSTDLVFDGRKGNYKESDAIHPLSIYAETKAAAESIVLANPKHTVVRTSLNGGTSPAGDRGFNEVLRRAFSSGQTLRLFTDEFRSPIHAAATARAVWELAAAKEPGLFHVAGSERLSRWDLGRLMAARWPQLNPRIEPESLASYSGAPRSPDTSLACGKVQRLLTFPLPGLNEWLAAHPEEEF